MLEEIKASISVAKLLCVLAVAVAGFAFGHHVAANAGKAALSSEVAAFAEYKRAEAAQIADAYKAARDNADANAIALTANETSAKDAADRIGATFNTIRENVKQHETDSARACALDADGLRQWRAANAAIGGQ